MDNLDQFSAPKEEKEVKAPSFPQASLSDILPNSPLLPAALPRRKGKGLLIVLTCLIFLILAATGVGAAAYFGYVQLPINIPYIQPDPQIVIKKMFLKMSELKAVGYSAEMKLNARTEASAVAATSTDEVSVTGLTPFVPKNSVNSGSVSFAGQSDWSDKGNVKSEINMKTSFVSSETSLLLGASDSFNLGLEARGDKNAAYLRVTEMPTLPFFDVSKAVNQWIKIDYSTGTMAQLADLQTKIKDTEEKTVLTPEQETQVKALLGKYDIFKVVKKFPEEEINGQKSYHYGFNLDKAELKLAVEEANKITSGKFIPEDKTADFYKGVDSLNMLDGEMWIGKKDNYLYRFSIASSTYGDKSGEKVFISLALVLNLNKFNEPLVIETPTNAISIEDLIKNIFGGALSGAEDNSNNNSDNIEASSTPGDVSGAGQDEITSSTPSQTESDIEKDSDNDGLTDYEETNIYHTDPHNPDTDGDGYKDGAEVQTGYNPNGSGKMPAPVQE